HIIDLDGEMVASINLHTHNVTVALLGQTSMERRGEELFAFRDWNQHRYLALVSLVSFAVDIRKVALFELKRDQNVGESDGGEKKMPCRHPRRGPERDDKAKHDRVPHDPVKPRRMKASM